jgi:hypothetical protein
MLSSAQVKTMLTTAASNDLRTLARVSALELADGVSPAEGRQSDPFDAMRRVRFRNLCSVSDSGNCTSRRFLKKPIRKSTFR